MENPGHFSAEINTYPMSLILNSVLHLESEAVIFMDVENTLKDAGVTVVLHAASCAQALILLEEINVDAAILDVRGTDGSTGPVAARLKELGIPFLIYTGSIEGMRPDHEVAQVIMKPANPAEIIAGLEHLQGGGLPADEVSAAE